MLDTHAVARSLTAADLAPAQGDAITNAVLQAAEQGDRVTADRFKAASPSCGPRSPGRPTAPAGCRFGRPKSWRGCALRPSFGPR